MAKYPPSTKIFPIEKSWFEAVGTINNIESVTAYIVVDGQNSFGGMVRSTAICSIRLGQKVANCDWTSGDMVAREMIPADAVHGPQPKPASK
ncbi:MAG TPA: hypothetical protein VKU19_25025 [Bryobacteraceae bacterium]|nr:hypothetical protein [Bryobacteraceae bacterium]